MAVGDAASGRRPHHRPRRAAADDIRRGVAPCRCSRVGGAGAAGGTRPRALALPTTGWIDDGTAVDNRADRVLVRARRRAIGTATPKGQPSMTESATVRVQRVMPATPDLVFDEWLDPESLQEWMCPRPVRVLDVTVEPHVGGVVRIDVDDSGTRVLISGQFLTIDRPSLLRFTWANSNWPDPTSESVVNVSFEPV